MNIVVTHGYVFSLGKDGKIYTDNDHISGYSFFKRYLDVFDKVTVVGRLNIIQSQREYFPLTGPGISFSALSNYSGPLQYLKKSLIISKEVDSIFNAYKNNSVFLTRSPENISSLFIRKLIKKKYPYAMEIISDPCDVFKKGSINHPLRSFFKIIFPMALKRHCLKASAVSYVTERVLQNIYPASKEAFTTNYSSIELDDNHFVDKPRTYKNKEEFKLIFVGSLAQMYKGQDTLIDAIALCKKKGVDVKLVIVGDGKHRRDLEVQASTQGLRESISFLGALPSGEKVRDQLDQADLFVLPSRGEGLPRAMIEAMARGLPCIGTSVSGIPELLQSEDLVPPGNSEALSKAILLAVKDPVRLGKMSNNNLEKAREFRSCLLRARRIELYRFIKDHTMKHIKGG
jgi:glycosyltransferase involved in cell wall biosynthesis